MILTPPIQIISAALLALTQALALQALKPDKKVAALLPIAISKQLTIELAMVVYKHQLQLTIFLSTDMRQSLNCKTIFQIRGSISS